MRYREAARKLRALGCQESDRRTDGSHRKWFNPASRQATTLPVWGSQDLKTGTLRTVVKRLTPDWESFEKA
jgi:predicted RNA binding protein YcfA (HicA-like mRNA interferase family)